MYGHPRPPWSAGMIIIFAVVALVALALFLDVMASL